MCPVSYTAQYQITDGCSRLTNVDLFYFFFPEDLQNFSGLAIY